MRPSLVCTLLLCAVLLCAALAPAQTQPKGPVPAPAGTAVKTLPASPVPVTAEETRANLLLVNALAEKNPDTRKEAAAAFGLASAREPYLTEIGGALSD